MRKLEFINKYNPEEFADFVFQEGGTISFNYLSSKDCAIVGNSGKILEEPFGEEIERHDCVVRFNAAPTEDYEEYVGERTDFRILNGPIMVGGSVDYVQTLGNWVERVRNENLILLPHERKRNDLRFNQAENLIHESNDTYKTTDRFEEKIKKICSAQRVKKPSTGLKAIIIFLGLIGNVNLYGFGFHLEGNLEKRHYWEDFKFDAPGGHNWAAERRFVKGLRSSYNLNLKRNDV